MMSSIEKLDKQIEALKAKRKKQLQKTHTTCKHPIDEVVDGKYRDGYFGATPPFRVCKLCGYAEEGWNCGYWKLHKNKYDIPQLDHDDAWKYVKEFHSQDDMYKLQYPERFDADGNEL